MATCSSQSACAAGSWQAQRAPAATSQRQQWLTHVLMEQQQGAHKKFTISSPQQSNTGLGR